MRDKSGQRRFTMSPSHRRLALAGFVAALLLPLATAAQSIVNHKEEPLLIVKDGRYGYINHSGAIVIPPTYLWGTRFDEDGYASVYLCGKLVSMDESGKLLPLRRANAHQLGRARKNGKFGFVDVAGNFKIKPIFDDALWFSDGLAAVQFGKLWGFIDTSGHFVIRPRFKSAYYFHQGIGSAETQRGDVLINRKGKVLATGFSLVYGIPQDGRIPVGRGDKCGYLDLRGNIVIPLIYDQVTTFTHGLAAVEKEKKWGYITTTGQTAIPFKFDSAGPFASGLAPVKIGNDSGFIERSGKFAFHLAFEDASGFFTGNADGLFVASYDVSSFWTKDNAFGYVNTSGKVIWGPTKGIPDHYPLLGWSEKDKIKSCEGVPPKIRDEVAHFPAD